MNATIYAQATGRKAPAEETPTAGPAEQELLFQARTQWLSNTFTQKLFRELVERAETLEAQARAQAGSQQPNNHLITKSLIVADELRNLIKQYGRTE